MRNTVKFITSLFLVILTLGVTSTASAQTGAIRGVVSDSSSGEPMPGVNVAIATTQQGAATDALGRFEITGVEPGTYVLSASFIGYRTETVRNVTVTSGTTTEVIISMQETAVGLEEIVAIGYGTQRKIDVTGAISSVDYAEAVEGAPVTSLEEGLQGRVPGVLVNQHDPTPGGGLSVQIRGIGTLGNSEPLYVVDGFPIMGGNQQPASGSADVPAPNMLNFLSPDDVESVEVLKGASATAVYGSRGANGVVLITTKSGRTRAPQFSFNYSLTSSAVAKTVDLLGPAEYAEYRNQQVINRYTVQGMSYDEIVNEIGLPFPGAENEAGVYQPSPEDFRSGRAPSTDWQEAIYRRSLYTSNASLSARGSLSDDTHYYLSGSVHRPQGVIEGSQFERYGLTSNFTTSFKNLQIQNHFRASAAFADRSQTSVNNRGNDKGVVASALRFPPTLSIGEIQEQQATGETGSDDPYTMATQFVDDRDDYNILESLDLTYRLSDAFSLNIDGGVLYRHQGRDMYWPLSTYRGERMGGSARSSYARTLHLKNENLLRYDQDFGAHTLSGLIGFTQDYTRNRSQFIYGNGFTSDRLGYYAIGTAENTFPPSIDFAETTLNSFVGRANYNYQDRYLFSATMRADGSSRFGDDNKWGYFPSAAFGWRIDQEPFARAIDNLSLLKLRLSYGITGNQGVRPYQSLGALGSVRHTLDGETIVIGVQNSIIPNPLLKWEETKQANAGLDVGLMGGRLALTADIYHKETVDLLQAVRLPGSVGFATQFQNLGSLTNEGIELQLDASILESTPVRWEMSLNYTTNRNEITDLGLVESIPGGSVLGTEFFPFELRVGEPIGSIYGYRTDGIFKTQDEVDNYADQKNKAIGEFRLVDVNGDDVIDSDDFVKLGNSFPDHVLGLSNTFRYKRFDVSFLLSAKLGQDRLNFNFWANSHLDSDLNAFDFVYEDSWRPEVRDSEGNVIQEANDDAEWHMAGPISRASDRIIDKWVEDATYLQIRSVRLGYTAPRFMGAVDRLRVYASVQNLLTLTSYSGTNPDASIFGQDPLRTGVDFGGYPLTRSILFGVELAF